MLLRLVCRLLWLVRRLLRLLGWLVGRGLLGHLGLVLWLLRLILRDLRLVLGNLLLRILWRWAHGLAHVDSTGAGHGEAAVVLRLLVHG